VRPTALARVARELATKGTSEHPLVASVGWWRRPERLLYRTPSGRATVERRGQPAPLLVAGAAGTLGRAIVRICERRHVPVVALARRDLDVRDAAAVAAALDHHRPWAVVNASGYVRVDAAETERARCFEANVTGAVVLAEACAARKIRYTLVSSDLVFDGTKGGAYVETDAPSPLNVYGESKALAERLVGEAHPEALVVRTSAFFGPWDEANFVYVALEALRAGRPFRAASDQVVSPTWIPDLADAIVTLLVDGASGPWHLACRGATSWADLARSAAELARISTEALVPCTSAELALAARRPRHSALASEKGGLLRSLEEGLAAFVEHWRRRTERPPPFARSRRGSPRSWSTEGVAPSARRPSGSRRRREHDRTTADEVPPNRAPVRQRRSGARLAPLPSRASRSARRNYGGARHG
jgi:dTDP-4-dehydrorhamnose reductase